MAVGGWLADQWYIVGGVVVDGGGGTGWQAAPRQLRGACGACGRQMLMWDVQGRDIGSAGVLGGCICICISFVTSGHLYNTCLVLYSALAPCGDSRVQVPAV